MGDEWDYRSLHFQGISVKAHFGSGFLPLAKTPPRSFNSLGRLRPSRLASKLSALRPMALESWRNGWPAAELLDDGHGFGRVIMSAQTASTNVPAHAPEPAPAFVSRYTVRRPYGPPKGLDASRFPGLLYWHLVQTDTDKATLIVFWATEAEFSASEAPFAKAVDLPSERDRSVGAYLDGGARPESLLRSAWARFKSGYAALTTLVAALGLIWALYSENYVRFFSKPNLVLEPRHPGRADVPLGGTVQLEVEFKNVDLYAPCVVEVPPPTFVSVGSVRAQGLRVVSPAGATILSIGVGEAKILTLKVVGAEAGDYKVLLSATARAGRWRSSIQYPAACAVRVWPEITQSPRIIKRWSENACTLEGGLELGRVTDKRWRGEATFSTRSRIQATDASFHGFELDEEVGIDTSSDGAVHLVTWISSDLPAFLPLRYSITLKSQSSLDLAEWTHIMDSMVVKFSTVGR